VLWRLLYLLELLEVAQAEKGTRRELLPYSLFYGMGTLEPLLLSILEAMDKFYWRLFGGVD
jgi:hypothetical protein